MMAHCAATQLAIENGLDQVAPEAGVTLLDDWIEQLNGVDKPGASGVAKDLERLKTNRGHHQARRQGRRRKRLQAASAWRGTDQRGPGTCG